VPTVINAFTDIDRSFGWKVFLPSVFSTILVVIAINGFDAGLFAVFERRAACARRSDPVRDDRGRGSVPVHHCERLVRSRARPDPLAGARAGARDEAGPRAHGRLPRLRLGADDPRAAPVLVGLPVALVAISLRRRDVARRVPFAIG